MASRCTLALLRTFAPALCEGWIVSSESLKESLSLGSQTLASSLKSIPRPDSRSLIHTPSSSPARPSVWASSAHCLAPGGVSQPHRAEVSAIGLKSLLVPGPVLGTVGVSLVDNCCLQVDRTEPSVAICPSRIARVGGSLVMSLLAPTWPLPLCFDKNPDIPSRGWQI